MKRKIDRAKFWKEFFCAKANLWSFPQTNPELFLGEDSSIWVKCETLSHLQCISLVLVLPFTPNFQLTIKFKYDANLNHYYTSLNMPDFCVWTSDPIYGAQWLTIVEANCFSFPLVTSLSPKRRHNHFPNSCNIHLQRANEWILIIHSYAHICFRMESYRVI